MLNPQLSNPAGKLSCGLFRVAGVVPCLQQLLEVKRLRELLLCLPCYVQRTSVTPAFWEESSPEGPSLETQWQ